MTASAPSATIRPEMAKSRKKSPPASPASSGTLRRIAAAAALAAACALAVLLAVRPISSLDLGYHLAYGEHFLDTGEIVDTNPYLYTVDGRPQHRRADLGPGCWWDARHRYRFPNANWLTQIAMAWVHRRAGVDGLIAMQVLLVSGTFGLVIVAMRRLRLPWPMAAAGVLIMCLGGYPRFSLRPELVSYLLLAAQLAILVGGRPGWVAAAALAAIQLAFVNVHSFWPIGLGLTGAFLLEAVLGWAWLRVGSRRGPMSKDDAVAEALRRRSRRAAVLGCTLLAQLCVSFVNPWTWRIVILPVQTVRYMWVHNVGRPHQGPGANSWARIGELYRTLTPGVFASVKATVTYVTLLCLMGLGAIGAVLKRRWAWLAVMAGLAASSMGHRRNIALAPLLATPVVLAGVWVLLSPVGGKLRRHGGRVSVACSAGVLAVGAWFVLAAATQRFYYAERLPYRLATGFARVVVPIGASEWLNNHRPQGRLWTDFDTSSNVHFFVRPHPGVPVLTNTWPQPPSVIGDVMRYCEGTKGFSKVERVYDPQIVVLSSSPGNQLLLRRLWEDKGWALVFLDAAHVIFLRADGPNAELVRRFRITPEALDAKAYVERLAELDPVPAYSVYLGGLTLVHLGEGWYDQAIEVIRAARDLDDSYARAWDMLGFCHAVRGDRRLKERDRKRGGEDLLEAKKCFERALELDPHLASARNNLTIVQQQLARLRY